MATDFQEKNGAVQVVRDIWNTSNSKSLQEADKNTLLKIELPKNKLDDYDEEMFGKLYPFIFSVKLLGEKKVGDSFGRAKFVERIVWFYCPRCDYRSIHWYLATKLFKGKLGYWILDEFINVTKYPDAKPKNAVIIENYEFISERNDFEYNVNGNKKNVDKDKKITRDDVVNAEEIIK